MMVPDGKSNRGHMDKILRPPGRDRVHEWANLIVGFQLPRAYVRSLSRYKFRVLVDYITYVWLTANDNFIPRVKHPSWLPMKYLWGKP
jgi:hypothetical protein